MTVSPLQILILIFAYFSIIFIIGQLTNKGVFPARLVRHPAVYVLSLGIYASSWAIYASVGFAYEYGYNFLCYYLGITGIFLLSPILLAPILNLAQSLQLNSLPDFFAYRFRSRFVGALTTVFLIICLLPLLSMQIKAISESIALASGSSSDWLTLLFCALVIGFALMFGARHPTLREKHEGVVMVIAFEAIVKLTAMIAIGLFALFGIFDGPEHLQQWLQESPQHSLRLYTPLTDGSWHSFMATFFVAAIVMPYMFHMAFTENLNPRSLVSASWGLPAYLLLIAICIPLILWAAIYSNTTSDPSYFTLGITMQANKPLYTLVAFLAGLSASTGILVVSALALSTMCINHLLVPNFQPQGVSNIYNWLLWSKRLVIVVIILLSYACMQVLEEWNNLMELGMLTFLTSLQFVPGIFGILFWPIGNRTGFLAGLMLGIIVWLSALLIPQFTDYSYYNGILIQMDLTPGISSWFVTAVLALLVNATTFFAVSLLASQSDAEKQAAQACAVDNLRRPYRWELTVSTIDEFYDALAESLGSEMAHQEVNVSLENLGYSKHETRPYALRRLRDQIETNLSGLLGPSTAHEIVDVYLPYKAHADEHMSEDIYFIESRLEESQDKLSGLAAELDRLRRFHRQTLYDLPIGVCSLSPSKEIVSWNKSMEALTDTNSEAVLGSYLQALPSPWGELLSKFARDDTEAEAHPIEILINNKPVWINIQKAVIDEPSRFQQIGGLVIIIENTTGYHQLTASVAHNERLASVGRLAAGVAHEIGNPITGIACLAQDMALDFTEQEIQDYAAQILDQTKRVTSIVQSLVNYSHTGQNSLIEKQGVSIFSVVSESIKLLKLSKKGKQHSIENLCEPSVIVQGDAQKLVQVFINLLGNSIDASPPDQPITVSCVVDNEVAVIQVIDQGTGIPEDIRSSIFEPFVTSKDPGAGTGLGLALVYGIIEEHQGSIDIHCPDKGTIFTIKLPL